MRDGSWLTTLCTRRVGLVSWAPDPRFPFPPLERRGNGNGPLEVRCHAGARPGHRTTPVRTTRAPEGEALPAVSTLQPERRTRHPKGRSEAEEARSALTRPERRLSETSAKCSVFGGSSRSATAPDLLVRRRRRDPTAAPLPPRDT